MGTQNFSVRVASVEDMKVPTRLGIMEDWHIGPNDFTSVHVSDPSRFFVGELDGKVISHISTIKHPGHSSFIGAFLVEKEHRGKGFGKQTWDFAWESLDKGHTIGLDAAPHMVTKYETFGFRSLWKTLIVNLDILKVSKNLANYEFPDGLLIQCIQTVGFKKLLTYDTSVYGTFRHTFVEKWINIPGSLGWAAVNEKGDILGYTAVHQIITDRGTDIQLCMAPLYADNDSVAKALMKVAVDTYQANEAISASSLELYCCDGESCGKHASRLMKELEADIIRYGQRMYTDGVPPGRQQAKMYGNCGNDFD